MLNWVTDQTKSNKALKILKEGMAQKYTMTIRSEIQMGSILSKTVTECRWALNVLDITDGGYELELLTLDNVMLETNNPSLKDIATMNNVFGQMYNELRFTVNRKGELLQVKNIEQLRKRWKHVRTELYEIRGRFTSIEEVLKLNDEVFANEKQLFDVIKATEFFELYFNGIYGKVLPSTEYITKKSRFQLADVKWMYVYTQKIPLQDAEDIFIVDIDATPAQQFSKDWIEKAYGSYPFLQPVGVDNLKPILKASGVYFFDVATGLLKEAEFKTEETAHPGLLYTKLTYLIKADEAK